MDIVLKNQVIEILEKEQDQLDGVYENQSTVGVPTSLTKKTVTQNEAGQWEENTEEFAQLYSESAGDEIEAQYEKDLIVLQQFCGEYDNEILSFDAQINALKTQIVNLSTEAINRNCWPGIAYSTTTSGGTTRNTGINSLTENFGGDFALKQDIDNIKIFPTMWGPSVNYGATNPFDPDSTVELTSSNSGYGYENVVANDGGSSVGTARTVSSTSGDHSGPRNVAAFRAYAGVGVAPDATLTNITGAAGQSVCVSIASSIASLESQITALRSQRDAAVSRSDLNSVKGVKKEKELQNWGAKNTRQQVTNRKTKNSGTLSAVTNLTS
jgi:hypothetical protein